MASVFSEKYEAMSSFESTGLWKRYERCEVKVENWGFVEEGGNNLGKNVEVGKLAGERSC